MWVSKQAPQQTCKDPRDIDVSTDQNGQLVIFCFWERNSSRNYSSANLTYYVEACWHELEAASWWRRREIDVFFPFDVGGPWWSLSASFAWLLCKMCKYKRNMYKHTLICKNWNDLISVIPKGHQKCQRRAATKSKFILLKSISLCYFFVFFFECTL